MFSTASSDLCLHKNESGLLREKLQGSMARLAQLMCSCREYALFSGAERFVQIIHGMNLQACCLFCGTVECGE